MQVGHRKDAVTGEPVATVTWNPVCVSFFEAAKIHFTRLNFMAEVRYNRLVGTVQ